MEKTEICRKVLHLRQNDQITLVYSLISELGCEESVGVDVCCYGIEIQCEERNESACVRNITVSLPKVSAMLDKIASGFVTPVTLRDVVLDLIG